MNLTFPDLPLSKTVIVEKHMTLEQYAIIKILNEETLSEDEIKGLKDAISFYDKCFPYLQSILLTKLNDTEIIELKKYLDNALNVEILVANEIKFELLFRVTRIKPTFIENGKVRNFKYLLHPPVPLLQDLGQYNRASSPDNSVFYASFYDSIALHEIKPEINERIIVTTWENFTQKPFNSFPISNNTSVQNKMLQRSNMAIQGIKQKTNPLLFDILDHYLKFLSSEFIKKEKSNHPKRIEYLYSSFFGDRLLNNKKPVSDEVKPRNSKGNELSPYDCILYPSVAFNHQEENVAITPESVKYLRPVRIEEWLVEDTFYDLAKTKEDSPIKKKIIRSVKSIRDGDILVWNDD